MDCGGRWGRPSGSRRSRAKGRRLTTRRQVERNVRQPDGVARSQFVARLTVDKVKGTANEVAGKVKQGAGEATDDPALKGEGKAQEASDLQKTVGKVKDAVETA
jgi:uncharacterized protein YjbJ (UPF0337 family)